MNTLENLQAVRTPEEEHQQFLRMQAEWEARNNTSERKQGLALARMVLAVSARVHMLLKERGWTQRELARRMEVPESNVSRILEGRHSLTLKTLAKLDMAFGQPILITQDEYKTMNGEQIEELNAQSKSEKSELNTLISGVVE